MQAMTNQSNTAILARINELAIQVGSDLGLTVVNTRLIGQGKQKSLEICIYRRESAISFADCEAMSRCFEKTLESEEANGSEIIGGSFTIDVISPGIDRKLTTANEFVLFAGKEVRILTKEKIGDLGTEFIAVLTSGDEQSIIVNQAHPLPAKKGSKKNSGINKLPDGPTPELTLSLSQLYGIYLWPGSNGGFKGI